MGKVWPALIEIARQRAELAKQREGNSVAHCESCATFSDQREFHHGPLLCPACGMASAGAVSPAVIVSQNLSGPRGTAA